MGLQLISATDRIITTVNDALRPRSFIRVMLNQARPPSFSHGPCLLQQEPNAMPIIIFTYTVIADETLKVTQLIQHRC
jgi:hypothetical protein